jgi:parallel beta-helix repeat protein
MKRVFYLVTILPVLFFAVSISQASHIQVCGDVSGIWDVDTVNVLCDIRVPPNDTLVIDPGAIILFQAYYRFSVESGAVLRAVGSDSNFITFNERFAGNGWHGIHFANSSDSSRLEYCLIKHGSSFGEGDDFNGGGINILQSNLKISNCIIDSCNASNGGAIFSSNGSIPIITGCTIRYCTGGLGGGIFAFNSNPVIKNCYFRQNTGGGGGAINLTNSLSTVDSNYFIANTGTGGGGGIKCEFGSNALIRYNTFDSNSSWSVGGGIFCATNSNATIRENTATHNSPDGIYAQDCNPIIRINQISGNGGPGINFVNYSGRIADNVIENNAYGVAGAGGTPSIIKNSIRGNSNTFDGGGLRLVDCNPKIKLNVITNNSAINGGGIYLERATADSIYGNTITENTAAQYGGAIYCNSSNPTIQNSILYGNIAQGMSQIHPVNGSSPIVRYCDVQGGWFGEGNIDLAPLFRNPGNNDFHLQSASNPNCGGPTDSPCIDTGNPAIADDSLSCNAGLGTSRSDMGAYGSGAIVTGIIDQVSTPENYFLLNVFPNPFNARTTIRFSLPDAAQVEIDIYDILGRKISAAFSGSLPAGEHGLVWDAGNNPSAVYFYRLIASGRALSGKMTLLK